MAKNSIEAYGAVGKSNVLAFVPEALTIVTDPASPLYDERVNLPVSEPLVLNIMHQGVLEPIIVCKNPETGAVEVVAGRQRVRAAAEANKRLRAQGCEEITVPGIVRRGNGAELAAVMVSENEVRRDDGPLIRAGKMARLQQLGRSDDDLAVIFGCTKATVRSTLALLDATAAVRGAVDAGKISATIAGKLAKLPPEEQRQKVAEAIAASDSATSSREKSRKVRAATVGDKPRMRSRSEVFERMAQVNGDANKALAWVLGGEWDA